MVISLPSDNSVRQARKDIRDGLIMAGEECVLLQMYHASTDPKANRCPVCWNGILNSPKQERCSRCLGTSFDPAIKSAKRAWAIFTDHVLDETTGKQGVWAPSIREMQTEAFPQLFQRDYVVRVRRWSRDHTPQEIEGIYICNVVNSDSLRTGTRSGQYLYDVVSQRSTVSMMSDNSAIYFYLPTLLRTSFDKGREPANCYPPVVTQPE